LPIEQSTPFVLSALELIESKAKIPDPQIEAIGKITSLGRSSRQGAGFSADSTHKGP